MIDCQVPTEHYYDALFEDLKKRFPKASPWVMEHVEALDVLEDILWLLLHNLQLRDAL